MLVKCPICGQTLSTNPDYMRSHDAPDKVRRCAGSGQRFLHQMAYNDGHLVLEVEPENGF